jgi:hypothetical protein
LVRQLHASNELLGDTTALRQLVDAQGYLFFRDVIDVKLVDHVKRGVMAWFVAHGVIDVIDNEPMYRADAEPPEDYPAALYETKLWEWFATRPQVQSFFDQVLGHQSHVIPIGEYQHTWPGKPDCWTRMHQDGPFFNHQDDPWGVGLDFLVFWFPLMTITEPTGGLAIVPTARSTGSLHRPLEGDASARFIDEEMISDDAWHRADYQAGDALAFGPFTPHCGMPNTSDRLRLSIDIRVEPAGPSRQITGVVSHGDSERIVVCADSGDELDLRIDDRTALRLPNSVAGRNDPSLFLGQRVVVTARDGRAIAVRNGYGYVPWTP